MKAVVAVLDEDLARQEELLASPFTSTAVPPDRWAAAEQGRADVEYGLEALEHAAVEAATKAADWRAKSRAASDAGRADLAEQARRQAAQAERERESYLREISRARTFLLEWTVRVTRAPSGQPSEPLANER